MNPNAPPERQVSPGAWNPLDPNASTGGDCARFWVSMALASR